MKVTIENLQAYLFDHYGGQANEQGMFMKLVEEIGEVAEILNQRSGRKTASVTDLQVELGRELADVIHYTVAIAAINGINLNDVIIEKDRKAAVKYNHSIDLESFIMQNKEAK